MKLNPRPPIDAALWTMGNQAWAGTFSSLRSFCDVIPTPFLQAEYVLHPVNLSKKQRTSKGIDCDLYRFASGPKARKISREGVRVSGAEEMREETNGGGILDQFRTKNSKFLEALNVPLPTRPEEGWIAYALNATGESQAGLNRRLGKSNSLSSYIKNERTLSISLKGLSICAAALGFELYYCFRPNARRAELLATTVNEIDGLNHQQIHIHDLMEQVEALETFSAALIEVDKVRRDCISRTLVDLEEIRAVVFRISKLFMRCHRGVPTEEWSSASAEVDRLIEPIEEALVLGFGSIDPMRVQNSDLGAVFRSLDAASTSSLLALHHWQNWLTEKIKSSSGSDVR